MTLKSLAIIAVSAAVFATPAFAAPSDRIQLRYNTAELATATGAGKLYDRIQTQAKEACSDNNTRPLRVKTLIERCEAGLVEEWVAQIDDTRLNSIHAAAKGARDYAAK